MRLHRAAAATGMAMMIGGGASLLLGAEPRLGALALAVFTSLGITIHHRERNEARVRLESWGASGDPAAIALGWSAFAGHQSSWIKNVGLIGACLFVFFAGGGPDFSILTDILGGWLGLRNTP